MARVLLRLQLQLTKYHRCYSIANSLGEFTLFGASRGRYSNASGRVWAAGQRCYTVTSNLTTSKEALDESSVAEDSSSPDIEEEDDPFMLEQIEQYNRGKRWLARMMGADPDSFTQADIDEAIRYLLPSSLWARDARPSMKHPYDVFPKRKDIGVDKSGRPYASAFFTGRPNYYDLTYEIWNKLEEINSEPPKNVKESTAGQNPDISFPDDTQLMQWMSKLQLEQKLNERISDKQYEEVLARLKRLSAHPNSISIQSFLSQYQTPVPQPGKADLKEVEVHDGEARAMGYRKTAYAEVFVRHGTGNITVNNKDFRDYFNNMNDREQIMYPLLVIEELFKFDVEAYVTGGGMTGKSGAIRLGMSKAIAALCPEHFEALQDARLLIRDYRITERQKPGQRGARRKFQWVKR